MIRPPGMYAVIDGQEVRVDSHARDFVRVAGTRHEMDELDDFVSVATTATWRGGTIAINAVSGDECGFFTNDGALAEREGLAGDFHNGWHGAASVDELTDVNEKVTSIHPRRRGA
ncbi:hypothetical protein [Nocardioides zhouii]|uniref:Uncharacterized protein n=1 Tax=Nocardioides zhouii TaxID=1168729 RepID=A0A4Q2SNZ5_9ACTN|nr:hypothetical protein [Nocardioides zhouii]RYC07352.1 hypothetical protein EUA94_14815 [Nocardioides zhouii]